MKWKLVPVEPDEQQIYAMRSAFYRVRRGGAGGQTIDACYQRENAPELAAYSAMLEAAPQPPSVLDGWHYCPECGSTEIRYQKDRYKQCEHCGQEWFSDIDYSDVVQKHLRQYRELLATSTQPEPPADLVRDAERWGKYMYLIGINSNKAAEILDIVDAAIERDKLKGQS